MRGNVESGNASTAVTAALRGAMPRVVAEQSRRDKTVWVRADVHAELARRARAASVSLGEYIAIALLKMKTPLPPAARIAAPLAQVSYRLIQIEAALERGDLDAARQDLAGTKAIVADALLPLSRAHANEARELARGADGWSG